MPWGRSSREWVLDMNRSLRHLRWDLTRFGFTPPKLLRRWSNKHKPKVLIVSVPKAGTHLLERALCLHPLLYRKLLPTVYPGTLSKWGGLEGLLATVTPGQVVASHVNFRPEYPDIVRAHDVHVAFQIRDPRDIAISHAHYASSTEKLWLYDLYRGYPDFRDRLKISIQGRPDWRLPSIGELLRDYAGWLEAAATVLRYESLVGPAGGGRQDEQLQSLRTLYGSLGLDADEHLVRSIGKKVFSPAVSTFRRGMIGQWREEFDDEISALFIESVGDELVRYGYKSTI